MRLLRGFAGKSLMLAIACLVCLPVANASAEYIQFTFTGEVDAVTETLWNPWQNTQLGDPVTVQFLVDSNAEDQVPAGNWGYYFLLDLTVTIGNISLATDSSHLGIGYDGLPWTEDHYVLGFNFIDGTLGSAFVEGFGMFSSDALPTDVDWTQYASNAGGTLRPEPTNDRFIHYNLSQFESVVIPTTPSLFVLLLGVSRRRRRL